MTRIKYIIQDGKRRTTLSYQKAWPTRLKETAKALGMGSNCKLATKLPLDASLADQEEAVAAGHVEWQRQCELMDAYSRAADAEQASSTVIIPGRNKAAEGLRRRMKRHATQDAHKRYAGKTLHGALGLYWTAHGIDPDTVSDSKGTRERDRYWHEWLEHMSGDYVLKKHDTQAIDAIQQAFDNWQDEMLARGCSHETVARARSSVITVIRWLSQEYRLGWHIELKRLPAKKRTAKQTLSVEEQRRLLALIAEQPSETTAMIAVMLAGGVMASEIKRMDPDAVSRSLASVYPYVAVGAGDVQVKTEARRRFVPIVWDTQVLEVVREYLPRAIESLATTADPTARVNKWLRTRGFTGITCHRLRDTMASVATAAMANPLVLARVGGWSGSGLNPTMLGYGAGDESSELLRTLTEEVARWWAPALAPDSPDGGNVVPMRRKQGSK